jgi:hypothetical protein
MTKLELLGEIREILAGCCEDPADAMIKQGEALAAIGKALKGKSIAEARAIINAVGQIEEITPTRRA